MKESLRVLGSEQCCVCRYMHTCFMVSFFSFAKHGTIVDAITCVSICVYTYLHLYLYV